MAAEATRAVTTAAYWPNGSAHCYAATAWHRNRIKWPTVPVPVQLALGQLILGLVVIIRLVLTYLVLC
jgi:hypothetical protein